MPFIFIALFFSIIAFIVAGAAFVGTLAAGVLIALGVLTIVVHIGLAGIIWTRRPPRRVWMNGRAWALLALPLGGVVAAPFFWLHYKKSGGLSCFKCGHTREQVIQSAYCPECGESFRSTT